MTDKNEVELAYDDAMEASNELGYACMTAGDVIRHQADEIIALKQQLLNAGAILEENTNGTEGCRKTETDYWRALSKNLAYYLSSALSSAQFSMTEETMHDALGLCAQAHRDDTESRPC